MANETPVNSALFMDRAEPLANSDDGSGRRALHVMQANSLVPKGFDSFFVTYPSGTVEIYTYKVGPTTVATLTLTYTDATKSDILSAVRT